MEVGGKCLYLLIDEDIFITFLKLIGKVQLNFPQIGSLLEKLSFYGKLLSFCYLSLPNHSHNFSGLFKLLSELFELLSAMSISATSLPNLPDFSSSKADIRVGIISISAGLKLDFISGRTGPIYLDKRIP